MDEKWILPTEMGVIIISTVLAVFLFRKASNQLLKLMGKRPDFDVTSFRFIQHSIIGLIIVVGIALVIFRIPGLRHVATTLITGAGILAVIVGIASQGALANIVSGVFIVIFKPYRIKDIVTIKDNLKGYVEDISLRHTVIRDWENKRIVIPNSVISNEVVVNSHLVDLSICKWIHFSISYSSDIDLAKKIISEEIEQHHLFVDQRSAEERRKNQPAVQIRVVELGEYFVKLRAWGWVNHPEDSFVLNWDILESVKKRFDKEGIEIPVPYRHIIHDKQTPVN